MANYFLANGTVNDMNGYHFCVIFDSFFSFRDPRRRHTTLCLSVL